MRRSQQNRPATRDRRAAEHESGPVIPRRPPERLRPKPRADGSSGGLGQDQWAAVGDGDRMLDVGGAAAVGAADGSAVGIDGALVDAAQEPRLDRGDHGGHGGGDPRPERPGGRFDETGVFRAGVADLERDRGVGGPAVQGAAGIYRETGDRHREGTALNNLGSAVQQVGPVRGRGRLLRAGHRDLPRNRRTVRRGPDPENPRRRLPGDAAARPRSGVPARRSSGHT